MHLPDYPFWILSERVARVGVGQEPGRKKAEGRNAG